MQKIELFIEELFRAIPKISEKILPEFVLKVESRGKGEGFHSSFKQGKVYIQAESPRAAVYGLSQLRVAAASGYLGDFLGSCQPRFDLRPIWIGCDSIVSIASDVSLAVPSYCEKEVQENKGLQTKEVFCRRILELGYNAVILGGCEICQSRPRQGDASEVEQFCKLLKNYGLKIILKPIFTDSHNKRGCCPLNEEYSKWLQAKIDGICELIPSFDYLFWEGSLLRSDFSTDKAAQEHTLSELVTAEAKLLEKLLPSNKRLIYFIPTPDHNTARQQAKWMPVFCDEVHKNTIISFSSVAGDCFEDHLPPHPFWEALRKSPDVSATKLLPLVNIGEINQGEGLWAAPSLDLIDKYYGRLYRHHFAGMAVLVNKLPRPGAMLDCGLWVASQALWSDISVRLLSDTWFSAFCPSWHHSEIAEVLFGVRQLVLDLSALRYVTHETKRDTISSEECRAMTESVLSRLKELQVKASKCERMLKTTGNPSISEYLQIFGRDAKRIVLHFLQCFNLSYPTLATPEDQLESFWMLSAPGSGQGIRSSVKVSFLSEPSRGAAGSHMETIVKENRWI